MKKLSLLFIGLFVLAIISQAQTVTDYDGNVYDTVNIGTQVWMKQNLKVTHYQNGNFIPNVPDSAKWVHLITGARCYYKNDSVSFDSVYGPLYNWFAVNRDICPEGWHLPSYSEWQMAENHFGGSDLAGGEMKEQGTAHWLSPNTGATNSSRFTGLPGGKRDYVNNFQYIRENGYWWTASEWELSSRYVWNVFFWYSFFNISHDPTLKNSGFSVRCVKDISSGLIDVKEKEQFKVFPNPVKDRLSIICNIDQYITIQIFNVAGGCVMEDKISHLSEDLNVSSLSKGIYVINAFTTDWTHRQKLIKE